MPQPKTTNASTLTLTKNHQRKYFNVATGRDTKAAADSEKR